MCSSWSFLSPHGPDVGFCVPVFHQDALVGFSVQVTRSTTEPSGTGTFMATAPTRPARAGISFITSSADRFKGMAQGSTKNVYAPINVGGNGYNKFNDGEFGSEHPAGTHFAMADGSVHFIAEDIDHTLYLALASRGGKETASLADAD